MHVDLLYNNYLVLLVTFASRRWESLKHSASQHIVCHFDAFMCKVVYAVTAPTK